jgi:hypothetical protein
MEARFLSHPKILVPSFVCIFICNFYCVARLCEHVGRKDIFLGAISREDVPWTGRFLPLAVLEVEIQINFPGTTLYKIKINIHILLRHKFYYQHANSQRFLLSACN